jgi:hypothetical protein
VTPRRRGWRAGLLLLALASSAAAQTPSDATSREAVAARVLQLAGALPAQAGPWQRSRDVSGDGITFASVGYRLGNSGVFATVFISHPMMLAGAQVLERVPDGPDSPLARTRHDPPGPGPGGSATIGDVVVPGGPTVRCGIAREGEQGRWTSGYRCATGVAGLLLTVRVTAPIGRDDAAERQAADRLVAHLLVQMTRSLAGLPPTP